MCASPTSCCEHIFDEEGFDKGMLALLGGANTHVLRRAATLLRQLAQEGAIADNMACKDALLTGLSALLKSDDDPVVEYAAAALREVAVRANGGRAHIRYNMLEVVAELETVANCTDGEFSSAAQEDAEAALACLFGSEKGEEVGLSTRINLYAALSMAVYTFHMKQRPCASINSEAQYPLVA